MNLVWLWLAIIVLGGRSPTIVDHGQALWWAWRAQQHANAFAFDDAIEASTRALAAAERADAQPRLRAWLHTARGNHVVLLYEWDRALADYDRAITLDPAWPEAYFRRGVLHYTLGPKDVALRDFAHVLALDPDGPHAALAAQYSASIAREQEALQQAPPNDDP